MTPRRKRPFARIPHRKHGYLIGRAAQLLSERGLRMTPWTLRRAADRGEIAFEREGPGRPRRFLAAELERYLWVNLYNRTPKA